ncbi:hypothetical protein TWF970_007395 [Orbilia oligospora]|uniref:Uncharacterized protein n=1 Tax=Orbilia oligospora TaxID=2813651 RepID=A0A7C8RFD9_ORBOL|nr:hypothetical protein TWF970_007395 [Orbilia oligospora]
MLYWGPTAHEPELMLGPQCTYLFIWELSPLKFPGLLEAAYKDALGPQGSMGLEMPPGDGSTSLGNWEQAYFQCETLSDAKNLDQLKMVNEKRYLLIEGSGPGCIWCRGAFKGSSGGDYVHRGAPAPPMFIRAPALLPPDAWFARIEGLRPSSS